MYSVCALAMLKALVYCMTALSATQGAAGSMSCDWLTNSNQQLKPYISAGSPTSITGVGDLTTCREQCMNQTTFICAAINYQQSTGNCQLLTENDKLSTAEAAVGWVYSVRPICAGIWLPWNFMRKGVHINGAGKYADVQMTNLQNCMTSCLRDPSGGDDCRSFTASVSGTACDLHNVRVNEEDERIVQSSEWQYFSKPSWYLETSNASSTTEVKDYSNAADTSFLGYALHIFLENKIPVSGYLVAWQYYLYYNSLNRTMCSTFAAIWRKVGADKYKLISRTLLIPENHKVRGVRFQFVQNETIRVEKDDLVSVFSLNIGSGNMACVCQVSGTDTVGDDVVVKGGLTGLMPGNALSGRSNYERTTSLKAYLSGYLSLKYAPRPHHNDSLRYGQVWLKLPPPLTTEDRVVVAGHRVICSTDVSLTPAVLCHDKLIPVSSRDVLLTLPNITRPYYAALQIVRNFKGKELPDDKHSPVSATFCAGQMKRQNARITKASFDEDDVVIISITILNPLTSGPCAKLIKVNYSGYDSGYRAIDKPVFTLRLDQGTTYDLKVHVWSTFEEEILLWGSTRTTGIVGTKTGITGHLVATTVQSQANDCPYKLCGLVGIGGWSAAGVMIVIVIVLAAVIVRERRDKTAKKDTSTPNDVDSPRHSYVNVSDEVQTPKLYENFLGKDKKASGPPCV